MRTRIAVVGDDEQFIEAARGAIESRDIELIPISPDMDLPSSLACVIGPGAQAKPLLDTAEAIGKQQEQLLLLIAQAVDAREGLPETSAPRLLEHATNFAKALDLTPDEANQLERGALLHDIGKLRVSNEVLLKKSVLDYDEWMSLQQHTTFGAELLRELGLHTDVCDIVQHHHENYDGTGYPNELEGEAIPRLARAMKILDVYCAMTAPRHYRRNVHSPEAVIEHLESERGKHFDPELLTVFVQSLATA